MTELGLLPLHGLSNSPRIALPSSGDLVLGRDPGENGVKIADPRCSRRHATLSPRGARWVVLDLGSKNGTWVNGKRVREIELQSGDNLRIGHAEFAFGPDGGEYRCASCLETLVTAPADTPYCVDCRRTFPLLGTSLGQRRLVRGLGTGSFGSVYVGHHRGTPYVALKVLHVEFTESPDVVMKFLKEAYATSGLEHENIVRFGDSGHESGYWFILLEYFPSYSLTEVLAERSYLPVDEAMPMARQILSALEYAHQRKLLHRDIKPGNILVNDDGLVKVVDFGLAKRLVDSAFTSQTSTVTPGTPLFMAPELLSGARATYRSDIYSAAATLFRMITGRHPIEARRLDEWFAAIQDQVPPPANSVRTEIPEHISRALSKGLAKSPNARYTSIAELAKDLGL